MYDINPNGGGPIIEDKLWFYASARFQENKNYVAGLYVNRNAGDPTKWLYDPDTSQQEIFSLNQDSGNGRLTWQVAPKHKVGFFYDQQRRPWNDIRPGAGSESASFWRFPRLRTTQASWTSPMTDRWLLEGRWSNRGENYFDAYQGFTPARDLIAVLEQGGIIPGLVYRGHAGAGASTAPFGSVYVPNLNTVLFSTSYVTGSHALKFGFTDTFGHSITGTTDIPEVGRLPVQQRHPEPDPDACHSVREQDEHARGTRTLRAGPVDDGQADAHRRCPLRLAQLLVPGDPRWAWAAGPNSRLHDRRKGIRKLEGHHATSGCVVRPVR